MMAARKNHDAMPDPSAVAAADEIRKRRTPGQARRAEVEGFGCPRTDWPHHFRVVIPEVRGGEIQIVEDFGVGGHAAGNAEQVVHCVLTRARWGAIADPLRREFNERLRTLGLPVGAWKPGITRVERMLGQELVLLACVCAVADEIDLPAITTSWAALRPEERWWFAGWLLSRPSPRAMRGAALLLSGGPADVRRFSPVGHKPQATAALPLFEATIVGKC